MRGQFTAATNVDIVCDTHLCDQAEFKNFYSLYCP